MVENTELLKQFASTLYYYDSCNLKSVWQTCFVEEDRYLKDCKPYLLELLNDEQSSNRFSAVAFLSYNYPTLDVGESLHKRAKIERNITVKSLLKSELKDFYEKFPELLNT